jgi:hypothetical protein
VFGRSLRLIVWKSGPVAAGLATTLLRSGKRLVHDAADGARASPALGAATQAMIDLPRGTRRIGAVRQRRTHVMVGEHVAGADNHLNKSPANWYDLKPSLAHGYFDCKDKISFIAILIFPGRNTSWVTAGKIPQRINKLGYRNRSRSKTAVKLGQCVANIEEKDVDEWRVGRHNR